MKSSGKRTFHNRLISAAGRVASSAINGAWRSAKKIFERVSASPALPLALGALYLSTPIVGAVIGHDTDHGDDHSPHSNTHKIGDSVFNVLGYVKAPDGSMSLKLQIAPGVVCFWDQPEENVTESSAPPVAAKNVTAVTDPTLIQAENATIKICGENTEGVQALAQTARDTWNLVLSDSLRDRLWYTNIYVGTTLFDIKETHYGKTSPVLDSVTGYNNIGGEYVTPEDSNVKVIFMPEWVYYGENVSGAKNFTQERADWSKQSYSWFLRGITHEIGHEYCNVTHIDDPNSFVTQTFFEERAELTEHEKSLLNQHVLEDREGPADILGSMIDPQHRWDFGLIQAVFPRTTAAIIDNVTRECGPQNFTIYNRKDYARELSDTFMTGSLKTGLGTAYCGHVFLEPRPELLEYCATDTIEIGNNSTIGQGVSFTAPIRLGANTLVDSNMVVMGDGIDGGFKTGENNIIVSPDFQIRGASRLVSVYEVGDASNYIFIYDGCGDPLQVRIPIDPFDRCRAVTKVKQDLNLMQHGHPVRVDHSLPQKAAAALEAK